MGVLLFQTLTSKHPRQRELQMRPSHCRSQNSYVIDFVEVWNGVWGTGCDEAEISEEKRLFTEWGEGIQWMKALVRNATGKAIQWRGPGHSVIRRALKTEFFCASSLQISASKSRIQQASFFAVIFYLKLIRVLCPTGKEELVTC